ncbi:MAG: hypothetical protein M3O15_04260, partial [Acidobacteriota bacterium]|nr:hypothetical protein [Acidobacteriota bacterium]
MHRPARRPTLPTLALVLLLGIPCLAPAPSSFAAHLPQPPRPARPAATAPSQPLGSRLLNWAAGLLSPGAAP